MKTPHGGRKTPLYRYWQLNGNAQKRMLQIVENIWLRHSWQAASVSGHINGGNSRIVAA